MTTTLGMRQARAVLGSLARRAHRNKEHFVFQANGIPLAVLMDVEEFEDFQELQDPEVQARIAQAHAEYLAGKGRPIEELLQELNEEDKDKPQPFNPRSE